MTVMIDFNVCLFLQYVFLLLTESFGFLQVKIPTEDCLT